jgi:uncharacterized SAM-binding protein YcdF (DUF218 family)
MRKRIFWLALLLLVVLLAYFLFPAFLNGMGRFLIVRDEINPADVIIVLSGDENGERVDEAVRLYRQGYARKVLMSGGPLAWRLTAAEWMKRQAVARGVPEKAIMLEGKSRSTVENARFSLRILKENKVSSCILVTSPQHSRRSKRVFNKFFAREGIEVFSHPVPLEQSEFKLPGWWRRHEDTQKVMWEYVAFVYYLLRGY